VRVLFSAAVLTLAWYAAINAAASLVVWVVARRALDERVQPRPGIGSLLILRFLPSTLALAISLFLFLPGHVRLEPRDLEERFPPLTFGLAVVAMGLIARSGWRVAAVVRAGRQLRRHGGRALPIVGDSRVRALEVPSFPGVSLAGILRPRVLVGQSACEALSGAELDVAVAHELAHQRAGDNVTRLLMLCMPDLFGTTRASRALEGAWRAEAECRADAAAVKGDARRAATLASALLKVARLTQPPPVARQSPVWSPFHEPRLLEARVKLLLANSFPAARAGGAWIAPVAIAAAIVGAWMVGGPEQLHELTEFLVRRLP
jgi:Zn-dependent protease with chaperone function